MTASPLPPSRSEPAPLGDRPASALDYQPLPAPPPAPQWPGAVAWIVILAAAGFMIVSNLGREAAESPRATGALGEQLVLSAKYGIGLRQILPTAPSGAIVQQLEALAQTDANRLHAAIAAAELQGVDQAMKLLDPLLSRPAADDQLRQDAALVARIYRDGPGVLDDDARQKLIDRHGFFGRLALSYNQPETDPLRARVLAESRRVALSLIGFGAVALLLGGAGLVLLIVAIVLYLNGLLQPLYVRQPAAGTVYLEMFAVYLLAHIGISYLLHMALGGGGQKISLGWNWAVAAALPITIGYGLLRNRPWQEIRYALGWHAGRGWLIEAPLGIVGYIAGLPLIVLGFGVTYVLIRLTGVTPSHPIQGEASGPAAQILLLYSIASLMAPVVEETMFRGALFHHLRQRHGWALSAVVVAILFAAIHPQGWATIPVLACIAIVLAGIREWRSSIIAPAVAHAFNNAMVVTLLVLIK
ncbi:lysostaphin resistance A-like protein [Fontivita pretiosa]|uniref:CPBP family intramembrane glutamic endopeptidase n=1 Tax=Fontivita pretiosa TaxID=2989684 RepID=UPI003D180A6E